MGEKFYELLRSFEMVPEFNGRNLSDLKTFIGEIIKACSLPIDKYEINLDGNRMEARFHTPLIFDKEIMEKLSKFFGWKNMVSILIGSAVHLLSKLLGKKVVIVGYKSEFVENEWRVVSYLKISENK